MLTVVLCLASAVLGMLLNFVFHKAEYRKLRRIKKGIAKKKWITLKGVTEFLYVTTQIAALAWVSMSYAIALYGTIVNETVYPVETISEQAIIAILGVTVAKTVGNLFEHNDGAVFGTSNKKETEEDHEGTGAEG